MEQTLRLTGHITAEQARQSPYLYLPFQVPQHTRRIDVSYGYSEPVTAAFGMGPGNTVDIGIFDSRGHEFIDAPGFRGWSGTAKREFFLAPHDATPGYIRGPLFPGEWNVLLGVSRIEPEGARYDVTVRLDVSDTAEAEFDWQKDYREWEANREDFLDPENWTEPELREPADARGGRWLKGDLHCHTLHSDGANPVEEVVRHAIGLGLDFLAVTDHNTNTHHEELDRSRDLPDHADPRRRGDDVLGPRQHVGPARVDRVPLRGRRLAARGAGLRAAEGRADLDEPPEVRRAAVAVRGLGGLPGDGGVAGAVALLQLGVAGALGRDAAGGPARRGRGRLGRALRAAGGAAAPARPRRADDVGLRRTGAHASSARPEALVGRAADHPSKQPSSRASGAAASSSRTRLRART